MIAADILVLIQQHLRKHKTFINEVRFMTKWLFNKYYLLEEKFHCSCQVIPCILSQSLIRFLALCDMTAKDKILLMTSYFRNLQ